MVETIPFIIVVVLHFSSAQSDGQASPCGLSKNVDPCRFQEPCKPSLSFWNDSIVIVSWEGLFDGCSEDQFKRISVRIKDQSQKNNFKSCENDQLKIFGQNKASIPSEECENSEIAIWIEFDDDHVNKNPRQQRTLITHDINCTASFIKTDTKNDTNKKEPKTVILVGSISGGVLIIIVIITISVVVLRKKQGKNKKMKNNQEKDINPVYGDYYYQDGNRRQNIVEV